jgi:hypothetical protein
MGAGIVAWFKGSPPFNIRITSNSKVVITYSNNEDLKEALTILEKCGVPSYGDTVSLSYEGQNPPYDEMRNAYDLDEKGHHWHPPFCMACMIGYWSFSNQLKKLFEFKFDPLSGIYKWIEEQQRMWSQTLWVSLRPNKAIAASVLEAMLPKSEG